MGITRRRGAFVGSLAAATSAVALLAAGSAPSATPPAAETVKRTVTIAGAVARDCGERASGRGVSSFSVPAPELDRAAFAVVDARLQGPAASDWDITVFDSSTGEVVAESAQRNASEVASGYAVTEGGLIVQACRLSGAGDTGSVSVTTTPVVHGAVERVSLVEVSTPTDAEEEQLSRLGLDHSEHGRPGFDTMVLHGESDLALLERSGLDFTVTVPDLGALSARDAVASEAYSSRVRRSALPSTRDNYRRLADYTREMKELAEANPDIVRPITLANKTYEGRSVEGLEITTNADKIRDGKPVFLQMGVHHAREWPSGEHAMEWAHDLINGYNAGNARTKRLVESVRTIVIPIVNPDGFNASREAGQAQGAANGRDGNDIANFAMSPNEYRRKNCRLVTNAEAGNCAQPAFGLRSAGVDPNRNYGAFWGGPGASGDATAEDFYGPGPFSEPETRNIRRLVSDRQVTVLITNHTFSNLVLRPPGLASQPDPIDDTFFKALADAMAGQNGYSSVKGYELYDTSGTTEDWSYNATGGFGFTFEIGCNGEPDPLDSSSNCTGNFHPTFPNVVAEYTGTSAAAQAVGGKGNREAYFIAMEAAADPERHSLIKGDAPPGAVLKVEKTFQTPTLSTPPSFEDHLETDYVVPDSAKYEFHLNPSTRPLVAQAQGRAADGSPSASVSFSGAPDPVENRPCAAADTTDPTCFTDHPFTIPSGAGIDNESATVTVSWPTPASDWDLYVYRDGNADGDSLDAEDTLVATSAQGTTASESATFIRPETAAGKLEGGAFVARVVNFLAAEPYTGEVSFKGPEGFVPAQTETWRFTCSFAGEQRTAENVLVNRGQAKTIDLAACGQRAIPGGGKARCQGRVATLAGSPKADRILGTKGRDIIAGLGGKDVILGRAGNDIVCAGKGADRVKGGKGKDTVRGGPGADRLVGANGVDRLFGGGGPDRLKGGKGADRCSGGAGKDRLKSCLVRRAK